MNGVLLWDPMENLRLKSKPSTLVPVEFIKFAASLLKVVNDSPFLRKKDG